MSLQKRRWCVRGSTILSLIAIIVLAMPVAAKEAHWATEPVKALVSLGIGGDELGLMLTDAGAPRRLDAPISPLQWQSWVRQALTMNMKVDLVRDKDMSFWVDAYTVPEHEGPRSVLTRGCAVVALMKIGNLLGFIPGGIVGPLEHLPRFTDWRQVEEKGLPEPWELMLACGIVSGYPDSTLRPEAPLTRAEAACLLKAWIDAYNLQNELSTFALCIDL